MSVAPVIVPIAVRNSAGKAHLDGIETRARCGEPIRDDWIVVPLDAVASYDRCGRCFRTSEEKAREAARRKP